MDEIRTTPVTIQVTDDQQKTLDYFAQAAQDIFDTQMIYRKHDMITKRAEKISSALASDTITEEEVTQVESILYKTSDTKTE